MNLICYPALLVVRIQAGGPTAGAFPSTDRMSVGRPKRRRPEVERGAASPAEWTDNARRRGTEAQLGCAHDKAGWTRPERRHPNAFNRWSLDGFSRRGGRFASLYLSMLWRF